MIKTKPAQFGYFQDVTKLTKFVNKNFNKFCGLKVFIL
jgi:hypothetical protein